MAWPAQFLLLGWDVSAQLLRRTRVHGFKGVCGRT